MDLYPLNCEAPTGEVNTFYWQKKSEDDGWAFHVYRDNPRLPSEEFYEVKLTFLDDRTVYTDMITNNNGQWAIKKGISEALFDIMSAVTECRIVSSRRDVSGVAEFQSLYAVNMWDRFCDNGVAKFDAAIKRYVWLGIHKK